MDTLKFISVYPFTWMLILFVLAIIFAFKRYKYLGFLCAVSGLVLAVSITPLGSRFWLDSVPVVTDVESILCKEKGIDSAILLPGGVVFVGEKISLTNWSKARLGAVNKYIENKRIKELLIPGGAMFQGRLEADYLIDGIKNNRVNPVLIKSGLGSSSTYSNFLELQSLINSQKMYYLFTSQWHLYRAFKVANKLGIKVCPVMIYDSNKVLRLKEYPWLFKAAIREYAAIIYYYLKGII
jgi:hypothetical protein